MIMIYSVCALFIDEVYFHDTTNSNGIIIDRVPPRKKVSAQRKCFYCDRLGKCFNLDHKVDAVFPMAIWSEFCMGQYRDGDHREDTPHFITATPYAYGVVYNLAHA